MIIEALIRRAMVEKVCFLENGEFIPTITTAWNSPTTSTVFMHPAYEIRATPSINLLHAMVKHTRTKFHIHIAENVDSGMQWNN